VAVPHVVVIGAGAGGLSAAVDLARQGVEVTVLETADAPGGKIRQHEVAGQPIDAGPTVFTLRWVFDELFEEAGAKLDEALTLRPATCLARHAWQNGKALDLFVDVERSIDAINAFAGKRDADSYRKFCAESAALFALLREPFVVNQRPSQLDVIRRVGLLNMPAFVAQINSFRTLWSDLVRRFQSPELRQLFARYATYVGSSPFMTPATIMIVAHVEQEGVWTVHGGMFAVAKALQSLGEAYGARYRFGASAAEIELNQGQVSGVVLSSGEHISADAVVFNGDIAALGAGLLGDAVVAAGRIRPPRQRSLSAVTWCVSAAPEGFDLAFHNVFFGRDYREEFDAVFKRGEITSNPTVYLCAQDRDGAALPQRRERMLLLVNAPANGEAGPMADDELDLVTQNTWRVLEECGLSLKVQPDHSLLTTPAEFHNRFPASGGALYGQSVHGMMATLSRAGAQTKVPGLFLAGGSVHPGPGVPMATISGRLAADETLRFLDRRM
jgi:1-hydroxycarotenoid 3,4-desaturase